MINWNFKRSVFINCPFDSEYRRTLESLIFLCHYYELTPYFSSNLNSADNRLDGIKGLIRECKFSIHDLSRYITQDKYEQLYKYIDKNELPDNIKKSDGVVKENINKVSNLKLSVLKRESDKTTTEKTEVKESDVEIPASKTDDARTSKISHDDTKLSFSDWIDQILSFDSRFNMPFELGLDLGCQFYSTDYRSEKKCLVLFDHPHVYDRIFSDFSGNDIAGYNGKVTSLLKQVRDFFQKHFQIDSNFISSDYLTILYTQFKIALIKYYITEKKFRDVKEVDSISIHEYSRQAEIWARKCKQGGEDELINDMVKKAEEEHLAGPSDE